MLISNQMTAALNEQIGYELGASLQYVALAAHFDSESLPELARHYYHQAEEERAHAMRIVKYIVDAGGRVQVPTIPAPQSQFGTTEEAVQKALDGEIIVTKEINALVDLTFQETDHITRNFLQWFVTEQLEEVSSAETLLRIVQRAGEQDLLHVEEYLARHRHRPLSAAVKAEDAD
jgi:ferritin